ncbi:MAG: putative hydrolase YxeP [Lentisphaerae bacterium ADurb.Bin242]|nr:MAG: putative hydrolase YxeP [Lentisphaerae bacterium ADurb.Bin242]
MNSKSSSLTSSANSKPDARIRRLVEKVLPEVIEVRHALHRRPELAGEEVGTASLIREKLRGVRGLDVRKPYLKTDVVALLAGKNPGANVTLRADIDALPMQEETGLPYASEIPGRMHGCGHDGHAAILLGAAKVLAELTDCFDGSVRFVFQPGEECGAMARFLVAAGALDSPKPDAVYALHAHSTVPVGTVKTKSGVLMAAIDTFRITLTGRSSIRSEPEKAADPLVAAADLVTRMQGLIASKVSPLDSAILVFKSLKAENPVGDVLCCAEIEGTLRYLREETGEVLRTAVRRQLKAVMTASGVGGKVKFETPYRISRNDPACVELLRRITVETWGERMFQFMEQPSMGSEDFCYFLERAPGAFFNLGIGENRAYCHNAAFDFNDEALPYGITLMVKLALETLAAKKRRSGTAASPL